MCLFKLHPEWTTSQDFPRYCLVPALSLTWTYCKVLSLPCPSPSPSFILSMGIAFKHSPITSVFCSKLSPGFPCHRDSHHSGPHVPGHPPSPLAALSHPRLLSCMSCNLKSCPHWDLCLSCFLSLGCVPRPWYGWLPPITQISNQRTSCITLHKVFQTLPLSLSPGFYPLVMG